MNKSWVVEVQQHPDGDYFIEFPPESLEDVGWKEGDTVEWNDNGDGSWTLTKKEEKEWVLVEAVSTFRMRYMVEVPKGKSEWALDTVVMNEAKEFSQEHLGEQIVSHRVLTEDDAIALCDVDNDYTNGKYGNTWTREQKLNAFFTRDGETVEK